MGAVYGAQLGMGVGGMIDPPKGPNIQGPRLSDLSVQSSTYGAHIPRVYGAIASGGNVFWLEGDKLKEVGKKQKSGGKGGGGGSSTTTYSYYATFAVGICKGPIAGVRRIWISSKLVFDAAAPTESVSQITSKSGQASAPNPAHIYLGTEDQQPDPRMQADRGVANVSAHRGLAYIVFYDYPLKDHGNSLLGAQVKVEVWQNSTETDNVQVFDLSVYDTYPESLVYNPLLNEIWTPDHSPNGLTRLSADTGAFIGHISAPGQCYRAIRYNANSKQVICASSSGVYVFDAWGAQYITSLPIGGFDDLYLIDPNTGVGYFPLFSGFLNTGPGAIWQATGGANPGATNGTLKKLNAVDGTLIEQYSIGVAPLRMVLDSVGRIWMYRWGADSGWDAIRLTCFDPSTGYITASYNLPNSLGSLNNDGMAYDNDRNSIWLESGPGIAGTGITEFDIDTGTFGSPITLPYVWSDVDAANPIAYDSSRKMLWVGGVDGHLMGIDTTTGAVHTIELDPAYNFWNISDVAIVNGDIWLANAGVGLVAKISPFGMTLQTVTQGEIVSAECLQSSQLSASDIDVTALTQIVRGYRVTQTGAIRGALDPLQAAWPFDAVQAGYKLKFIPRGTAPVATIPASDLDAHEDGSSPGAQMTVIREMDSQLPQRLTLSYVDPAREYDPGEQPAERRNVASINVREIELPIVLTATEGAQVAERLLRLTWLERTEVGPFRIPPTYLGLEPADVVTIVTDAASYRVRLVSVNYLADGRLECAGKLDAAATYTPAALGEEGASVGAPIVLKGLTRAVLLDIPLMRQADNVPGFPVALTGYLAGWPGGILYRSPDAAQTWDAVATSEPPGATIGTATNSIGTGRTDIIDTASALAVSPVSGSELSSVTELHLFEGSNLFAYGANGRWEILGARDCTQQIDGSWVLTNLLRGRFGTEWAMTLHATGDMLVKLSVDDLSFISVESSMIGASRLYRAITAGASIDSDTDAAFAYAGVNLECLAPVYLNGNRHPSTNDWTLTWLRRTRYGGEWRDFVDATLAETTESYEIEIYDSAYTTLKRTLTATSATVAYTSAQQVTDWGSNQSTLYLKIYQMSDVVGRGYPLTTSITR
jgi:hypothetical protein